MNLDVDALRQLTTIEGTTEVLAVVFLIVILVEALADRLTRAPRDFGETRANLLIGLGQELLSTVAGRAVGLAALGAIGTLAPVSLPVNALTWILGFIIADFTYYWSHRLEHRSRIFWAHHGVHHSSSDFDLSTAARISWVEPFVSWYSLVPLVLLGFHPLQAMVLASLLLLYQTWIHSKRIGRLPLLEGILNTPSAHRVHHGSNPRYLDANYGAVLMLWDRMFGTYVPETQEEPVRFGLTTPIGTTKPLAIHAHEYRVILRGLRERSRTLLDRVLWVFGPPEWSPERGLAATRASSLWHRLHRALAG